uniref:Myb-like domain-containing protein n=1 Tax=Kalanchoe fedtschenkoi TaxID=63787 RepID=A0A7N0ZUJ0_KALFE
MFDGMHNQDQLFHQFISFSSPSSSRPPPLPSSLHHQQLSSPFPASFPVASPPPIIPPPPPNQSIQFSDLFHRPTNLPSFHHLNPAPSPHNLISSKQYTSDQHTNSNSISDVLEAQVHPKDEVGLIRSLFPRAAASSSTLLVERERPSSSPPTLHQHEFWSNEEVVALLRIRSSSETSWFPPDFTWEHVSRKLAAIGFKRSAKTCKEKFEEESKTCFDTFNNRVISDRNSYRIFSELENICGRDDNNAEKSAIQLQANDREEDPIIKINNHQDMQAEEEEGLECENKQANTRCNNNVLEEDADAGVSPAMIIQQYSQREQLECREKVMKAKAKKKKKIRQEHKFQIMKGLCEGLVNKMMTQQEELHNKILEDLLKRDEENKAREEAWKRMEVERLNTELEIRAQEQAIAGDRQAAIIDLLSTTTTSATSHESRRGIIDANIVAHLLKPIPHMSTKVITQSHDQNPPPPDQPPCPNLQTLIVHEALEPPQTPTSTIEPHISNPPACLPASYSTTPVDSSGGRSAPAQLICYPKPSTKKAIMQQPNNNSGAGILSEEDQHGVRWPRDQVLALIDLRCSLLTNKNGDNEERDEGNKQQTAPLWERISRKMFQLGYQRSAKRCKEKWENINKYFRKTKDNNVNKKRSNDSRTCPYFHQLSQLYEQGTLTAPSHHHTPLLENGQNKM